ncbi:hypothetical protein [Kribbella kalugense]|nr:hypothetical protein [Kribbella kalugense]
MTRYQRLVARIEDPDSTGQVTKRPWETDRKLYATTHQPVWQMCLRDAQNKPSDYPFAGDEIRVRQALRNLLLEHGRLEPERRAGPSEDALSKAFRLEAADDAVSSRIEALGDQRLEPLLRYSTEPETGHYPAAARKLRENFAAAARQVGRDDLLPLRVSPYHVMSAGIVVDAYSNITGMTPGDVSRHLGARLGELETVAPQAPNGPERVDRIVDHATFELWSNAIDHQLELARKEAEQTADPVTADPVTADPVRVALGDLPNPGATQPVETRGGSGGAQDGPVTRAQRPGGLTRT